MPGATTPRICSSVSGRPGRRSWPVLWDRGILNIMQGRGFSPDEANRSFAEFVRSGEEDVLLEIIFSDYQEMLESEIGRCIHEDRIIEQRLRQQYRGPLARNIQYLLEYLFAFPAFSSAGAGRIADQDSGTATCPTTSTRS